MHASHIHRPSRYLYFAFYTILFLVGMYLVVLIMHTVNNDISMRVAEYDLSKQGLSQQPFFVLMALRHSSTGRHMRSEVP